MNEAEPQSWKDRSKMARTLPASEALVLIILRILIPIVWLKSESEVAQSCPTLCGPMDCSPPGSTVHGILQARTLERVAMPSSRGSPDPGMELLPLRPPALAGGFLTTSATWEALL